MGLFSFGGASGSKPGDRLTRNVIRQTPQHVPTIRGLWQSVKRGLPCRGLDPRVFWWRLWNMPLLLAGVLPILAAKMMDQRHGYGVLTLTKICQDGTRLDYGTASHRLITTAGVNKIVAGLNATDTSTFSLFKFHAFGTGATAPAIGDTALQTEFTTQYNPDNTRPTGSQTVGGTNNVYRTVGTFTPDASCSPAEMGLLSQAATGGGTLLDRFTFTAIPLNGTGDALQTTVDITFPAGS